MDGILVWLAAGAAGVFFVSVLIAGWEQVFHRRAAPPPPAAAPARAVSVDVDLDSLPVNDAAQRRELLDDALERMTQPGALQEARKRWTDTTPMVGPGPAVMPGPSSRQV